MIFLQSNHIFLSYQGIKSSFEKTRTILEESLSIQSFIHALSLANSMAVKYIHIEGFKTIKVHQRRVTSQPKLRNSIRDAS